MSGATIESILAESWPQVIRKATVRKMDTQIARGKTFSSQCLSIRQCSPLTGIPKDLQDMWCCDPNAHDGRQIVEPKFATASSESDFFRFRDRFFRSS